MKKSILASLLLASSFCFANEALETNSIASASEFANEKGFLDDYMVASHISLGSYNIDSDNKFLAKFSTHFISDQFNPFSSLDMKEEYTLGDGISRVDLLVGSRGAGINLGYIDLHHKNLDGGYLGIGGSHKFGNGVEVRGSYAPIVSGDMRFLGDIGVSVPLFNDISLNVNYTIIGDERKEKTQNIIYSGNSLVTSTIVEGTKDAKNTEMLSVFIKIPLGVKK